MRLFYILLIVLQLGPALMLIFALLRSDEPSPAANRVLAGLIFLVATCGIVSALTSLGLWEWVPWFLLIPLPVWFVIGPAVLLYFRRALNPSYRYRPSHLLHLLPVVAAFLFLLPHQWAGQEAVEKWQSQPAF